MNRKMFVTQTSSSGMEALGLILFMWASLSGAFNIDTEHPLRFNGTPEDFFGYSVYQTEFGNRKQIIVGAPLEGNSTGEMYSCSADLQSCKRLQRPGSESVRFFGMSAAVSSAALTSCSPYFPHECDGNSYLNGVCYQFSSSLQAVSNFTAAYQVSSADDSVTYLNFSLEDRGPKPLNIIYKVENLGVKGLPVSVTLTLPCQTTHVILTPHNFSMQENSVLCNFKPEPRDGHCGKFECHQFHLQKFSEVHFNLTAFAVLQNEKEYESKYSFYEFRRDIVFNVSPELHYNTSHYNQTSTGLKYNPHRSQTAVKVEFVVPPSRMLIVGTGVVGGFICLIIILFLLLKCGFFKRNRPDEFFQEDENVTAVEDSPLMNVKAKENRVSENDSAEKENGARETSPSPDPPNADE
ncbi:uncharacterized protein LOC107758376 [Sinocyclocheilus rhinocerous]|uniref:uncharacterized protein LOC107758376 n=1 Tax=Sinocyclocheilus rhinocerous TaxID=307959 RepID=UPI0007B9A619|nr:PREDICTED: uncharacterized protein LOC107758376 [Sinocyclocheilus rhinocerous]